MGEPDALGTLPNGDTLAVLQVIDRLVVGPVRLEPRRLVAPYTVVRGDQSETTELIYRYGEDVFDPHEPLSNNLAALIAAQVALNYGLFCRRIVLHGPFDLADRRFLTEMAANTAREIYVKKFLEPNPFLRGAAAELPAERRSTYLRAELVFPGAVESRRPEPPAMPPAGGVAVLASGGKDSLLSLGLLEEMELAPHSIFINESGRHWYTALNAFRHLEASRPQTTTRVWTSADRVFSWMLRRLPFVRQDFAQVRADEYPIRLWTVAVFLFGALPVVRRRRLARLVIGDEFDTTRRLRRQGITHYDGLYDQSRYFDEALSRFYRRKGWPLVQFSLLRQMSELLIQKVLAERYPELLACQTSCHATHVDGERVYPCGRCEKCRRIVGMLLGLGADPGACGYSPEQVAASVEALGAKGVHQEAPGVEHLAWMLAEKGILPPETAGLGRARPRPEMVLLRFDDEASPISALPRDLRRPLYELLLESAGGAVRRRGREWLAFHPLEDPEADAPYRLERPAAGASGSADNHPLRTGYLLAELSWEGAKARLAETDTALLPVGAIEQHGPHLPLDLDAWDADHLCREVAERCTDPKPLVLPLIPYGASYHHDSFPGTLSVSPDSLAQFVYEVGMAAARHGVSKLVIINGHGGNAPALQVAAQKINRDARIFTCVDTGETSDTDVAELVPTRNDAHAGEIETSTALATRPHLVDSTRLERAVPQFSSRYLDFTSAYGVEWYEHTARISATGVMGDATAASREKGEKIWELMIDHLTRFLETLKELSLDEIYGRRH